MFNAQLATDTATQVITGVEVTDDGSDQGQLVPMVAQHVQHSGRRPAQFLTDGGFAKHEAIEQLADEDVCTLHAGAKA